MELLELILTAAQKKVQEKMQEKAQKTANPASAQILKLRDSMRKNGFKEYEFIANRGCCQICAQLNNKHFPIAKLKIGVNAPPMHKKCRCSIAAYQDQDDYEAWLNFISKGGTTAQWNKKKKHK